MTNHFSKILQIAALAAILCLTSSSASAQNATRSSLGLTGASIFDVIGNSDGSKVVALAEGPFGIFYSTDFGTTWSDARDEIYSGGFGVGAVFTADKLFIVTGLNDGAHIYMSDIADTLSWSQIDEDAVGFGDLIPTAVSSDGTFVFVGTKESRVLIFDAGTGAFIGSSLSPATPGLEEGQINSIALDSTNSIIYIQTGLATGIDSSVYRSTYDTSTGAVNGAWTEKKPAGSGFHRVYVAPNAMLYVTTFNGNAFQSNDNGDSYLTLVNADGGHAGQGASFVGAVHLVGYLYSINSGTSFTALRTVVGDSTERTAKGCYINPSDTSAALMSSDLGVTKTADLHLAKNSTWSHANSGLEGVVVNAMAQVANNKDRVLLATNNGIAFTNDFTASSPTWSFPIRPLATGGLLAQSAVFNPDDADQVFTGDTDIFVGAISGNSIVWYTVRRDNTPAAHGAFGFVTSLSYLQGSDTLVATWRENTLGALNGKISFLDPANGTENKVGLNGKPVKAFIAVTDTLMFAGLGAEDSVLAGNDDEVNKGIYRSTDGGDTWVKLSDSEYPVNETQFLAFAYDADNDVLYSGVRGFEYEAEDDCDDLVEDCDDDEPVEDDDGFSQGGTVLMLDSASTVTPSWRIPRSMPVNSRSFGAVAIDADTKTVYTSAGKFIYRSFDNGDNWHVYYEGLESENTSMLFFDALVQGSNTGFYALTAGDIPTSPVRTLWNGFFGMKNILELVNRSSTDTSAVVTIYDSAGQERGALFVPLGANGQADVDLNMLEGFAADSYGIAQVTFDGQVDGRVSFYLPESSGDDAYALAFSVPFRNAATGTTNVAYNTIQPALNPGAENGGVTNWLSIVNLDPTESKIFTIERYGYNGGAAQTSIMRSVPPLGRVDVEGGHEIPGAGFVGYNKIIPQDISAPYLGQLVRYGTDEDGEFVFGVPLAAQAGGANEQWVSISKGGAAQNWLELVNTSSGDQTVTLTFYDNNGTELEEIEGAISGNAQYHVDASAFLADGTSGAARIVSDSSGLFIAQSMFYFRDNEGGINTVYAKQAGATGNGTQTGSYNLYLGMNNWLRIFNASDVQQDLTLEVFSNGASVHSRSFALVGNTGMDLGLHEAASFGTSADTYGTVRITGSGLVSDVIRLRLDEDGELDFVFPTAVR